MSLVVNLSLNQISEITLFYVRETWMTQFILAISLLIRKDSVTHVHGLAVYENERLPFARDLSLEHSEKSNFFPTGFTSFIALFLFPLSMTILFIVHSFSRYFI